MKIYLFLFRVYNVTDCQSCRTFDCAVTDVEVKLKCIQLFDCTEISTTTSTTTTTVQPFKPKYGSSFYIIMLLSLIVIIGLFAFVLKKKCCKTVSQSTSEEMILMSEINLNWNRIIKTWLLIKQFISLCLTVYMLMINYKRVFFT